MSVKKPEDFENPQEYLTYINEYMAQKNKEAEEAQENV